MKTQVRNAQLNFNKSALVELNDAQLNDINSGATPSSSSTTAAGGGATTSITTSSPWCIGGAVVIGIGIGIWAALD